MPDRLPPSLTEIEELAQRALGTIPRRLKRYLGPVVIQVEEFPDEDWHFVRAWWPRFIGRLGLCGVGDKVDLDVSQMTE